MSPAGASTELPRPLSGEPGDAETWVTFPHEATRPSVLIVVDQLTACVVVQDNAIAGDMCKAGCADIEAAYGVRTSHIRARFGRVLNQYVRDVKTAGLWTAWNRYPEPGTDAFTRACSKYWEIQNRKSVAAAQSWEKLEPMSDAELEAKRQEVIENEHHPEPPPVWEGWD